MKTVTDVRPQIKNPKRVSVFLDGETLTLDGALLARIGLSAASMGDTSRPGVLLSIEQEKGETL